MAHPETPEAADAPAPASASDKAADFEKFLFSEEEEQEEGSEPEGEDDPDEDIDLEGDEEGEDEGEPEPAIPAPASLNAEEKAVFAQLPKEAQEAWSASENRRNADVTRVTQQAANREREAQAALERADVVAEANYAAQLKAFVDVFRPQMPDPQLAQIDPQRYIAEEAKYRAEIAQFSELEQQIGKVREQAQARSEQVDQRARVADLMTVPELANPETRDSYVAWAREIVSEIGLDADAFEQNADSTDFRSLKKVDEWRQDAIKYREAMKRQMQKVRAGKSRTLRPNAPPAEGVKDTKKAWERVKAAGNNRTAQADAFASYLSAAGVL